MTAFGIFQSVSQYKFLIEFVLFVQNTTFKALPLIKHSMLSAETKKIVVVNSKVIRLLKEERK
jgi:hypothetical protein